MKLRYYTAFVTGALAEILTAAALWKFTEMDVLELAFIAMLACLIGTVTVLAVTEKEVKGTMIYTYKVARENVVTGERAKRCHTLVGSEPLKVGGLYCHLGAGYPGFQRILKLVSEEPDY